MSHDAEIIILRAYAEASLAAKEKGLTGIKATNAVMSAAAKVSSRILGRLVTPEDVRLVMQG